MTYDFDYYSGRDLTYPKSPKKPWLNSRNPSADDAIDYAKALKQYEQAMVGYRELANAYNDQMNKRMKEFQDRLRDECDLSQAQFNLLWAKAWEDGHSAGLNEVFYHFEELYELATEFASLEG